jgi:hypothetical protein
LDLWIVGLLEASTPILQQSITPTIPNPPRRFLRHNRLDSLHPHRQQFTSIIRNHDIIFQTHAKFAWKEYNIYSSKFQECNFRLGAGEEI